MDNAERKYGTFFGVVRALRDNHEFTLEEAFTGVWTNVWEDRTVTMTPRQILRYTNKVSKIPVLSAADVKFLRDIAKDRQEEAPLELPFYALDQPQNKDGADDWLSPKQMSSSSGGGPTNPDVYLYMLNGAVAAYHMSCVRVLRSEGKAWEVQDDDRELPSKIGCFHCDSLATDLRVKSWTKFLRVWVK